MFLLLRHMWPCQAGAFVLWQHASPQTTARRTVSCSCSAGFVDGEHMDNPFYLIALWQELEWLSQQLYNRFAVKTEILCISPPIY